MPITPGRVAWYVTGRFYLDQQGKLQDLGYFLHLEGVQGPLFNQGTIGEASARLTFRSEPFEAQSVTNGNIAIGLDTRGEFSVYFNPAGGGDFGDPGSFSRGTRVAVFRRTSVVMGQTLSSPTLGGFAIATNVFSAELVDSAPFLLGDDDPCDLRDLLPDGITQWGTMNANPLATSPPFTRIAAFTGSAVAAG
ncbi:MAG TPA: hypothetical protein VFR03_16490 [Thermoanaerobaculia bacterium]|nr:hypothetical protein [Thermoanaerobaculia bacterium]